MTILPDCHQNDICSIYYIEKQNHKKKFALQQYYDDDACDLGSIDVIVLAFTTANNKNTHRKPSVRYKEWDD